jgi:glycosyltransferase involved in cell wall biosynthesis
LGPYIWIIAGKNSTFELYRLSKRSTWKNNAGLGCVLCSLDEFVEKVLYLNSHREELLDMGRNARRVAEERFDRDKLAMQALEVVISIRNN